MLKVAFFTAVPRWWYDTVTITKTHELYASIPKRLLVHKNNGKYAVRLDYYVGYMLKHTCGSFAEIDIIPPRAVLKLPNSELNKYNLIINQFLSPLAVFHFFGADADKRYRVMLARFRSKVYPVLKYTTFVEDKCVYTNVLKKAGFPVANSFCVSRSEYMRLKTEEDRAALIQKIIDKAHRKGWAGNGIFAKPILGTGSWGATSFDVNAPNINKALRKYFTTSFEKKQYPKLMFQEYHPEFGTSFYEVRMVFVGDKYMYTVMNSLKGVWKRPVQEGGTKDLPQFNSLKQMARDIIRTVIKPLHPPGTPLLETRIDFGCCVGHEKGKYFINEVEYAGGLMTFMDKKAFFGVHDALVKQLKTVLRYYM